MIKVANCPCSLDDACSIPYGVHSADPVLCGIAARSLGVRTTDVVAAEVLRRSVDARKKANVHFVLTIAVELRDEGMEQRLLDQGKAQPYEPYAPLQIDPVPNAHDALVAGSSWSASFASLSSECNADPSAEDAETRPKRPIVVGLGPAGLFAALYLARSGLRPLVVERGASVRQRQQAVEAFSQGGPLDLRTNIQFGEGGAGTFSDGKLTTGTKHPHAVDVLHWFVEAGAPLDILWDAKPHIGSDVLPGVVETMRTQIEEAGGEVLFQTRLADVTFDSGRLCAVQLEGPDGTLRTVAADTMVLACGHSARDTFQMLFDSGLTMEQKPFSMGVRIEHLQHDIDVAQYGAAAAHPALGAADYKMAVHVSERRSAYTFCMCPGGEVVCAASEAGGICTNGMSNRARDGSNANAALLVNVDPQDLDGEDPLAGMHLQRAVEQRAYQVAMAEGGSAYQAPAQTVGSFLGKGECGKGACGKGVVQPTYARGTVRCDLHDVLPAFVCDTMMQALPMLDRKLRGFAADHAIMTAPETRSSSPVRIVRNDGYQAMLRPEFLEGVGAGTSPEGDLVGVTQKQALDESASRCDRDAGTSEQGRDASDFALAGSPMTHAHGGCGIYPCGEGPGYAGGIMSAAADGMRVAVRVAQDLREQLYEYTLSAGATALQQGGAIVFPTDTVAGLGVSVIHAGTPEQIYRIKQRKPEKPIAWLVDGPQALLEYGCDVPDDVIRLAETYWPGPLTIIVKASSRVPEAFCSQAGTIGLRMPRNDTALRLISAVGGPLATSSANRAGQPAAATPEEAPIEVRHAAAAVVADGTTPSGLSSTVLDCTGDVPHVLREGAIAFGTQEGVHFSE